MWRHNIDMSVMSFESNVIDVTLKEDSMSPSLITCEDVVELHSMSNLNVTLTNCEILMVPEISHWRPYTLLMHSNINSFARIDEKRNPSMDSVDDLGIFRDVDGDAAGDSERAGSTTSVSLEITDLTFRISLNDFLIMQNILLRRTLVESNSSNTVGASSSELNIDTVKEAEANLSHYEISITSQNTCFILMNDFDPVNVVPLVKLEMNSLSMSAKGRPFISNGKGLQGHVLGLIKIDYHNQDVAAWEPIVEEWSPSISFSKNLNTLEVCITTEHNFQITLTSKFLECFFHTYATLLSFMPEEERVKVIDETEEKESAPTSSSLTIVNKLGVDVLISTDKTWSSSDDAESWNLAASSPSYQRVILNRKEEYDHLNIHLHVRNHDSIRQMEPLCGMQTCRSSTKVCRLWPVEKSNNNLKTTETGDRNSSSDDTTQTRVLSLDEELFEYQRYVIGFGRSWKGRFCLVAC